MNRRRKCRRRRQWTNGILHIHYIYNYLQHTIEKNMGRPIPMCTHLTGTIAVALDPGIRTPPRLYTCTIQNV